MHHPYRPPFTPGTVRTAFVCPSGAGHQDGGSDRPRNDSLTDQRAQVVPPALLTAHAPRPLASDKRFNEPGPQASCNPSSDARSPKISAGSFAVRATWGLAPSQVQSSKTLAHTHAELTNSQLASVHTDPYTSTCAHPST